MKYEDLKARFNQFSKCDETYVTIPREYLLTLIGELLKAAPARWSQSASR